MGFLWLNPVESDKNNTEVTKKKKKSWKNLYILSMKLNLCAQVFFDVDHDVVGGR